jgi:hypothetical protein
MVRIFQGRYNVPEAHAAAGGAMELLEDDDEVELVGTTPAPTKSTHKDTPAVLQKFKEIKRYLK